VQRFFPKELDRANGLGGGLPGDLLVVLEEDEVLAEFLGAEGLGGFAEVLGQLTDTCPVGLASPVADPNELQVIGEGF
jgi:hypothetical protein